MSQKQMRGVGRFLAFKFIEFVIPGILVYFAARESTKVDGHDPHAFLNDTLLFLLSFIAVSFLLEPHEQRRELQDLRLDILELDRKVREIIVGLESVRGKASDVIERFTLALRFTNRDLSRREVPRAWEQMLWHTKGSFCATNFVRPDDYDGSYPDLGLLLQEARTRVEGDIVRRIFIVADASELETMAPQIAKQIGANIDVKVLLLAKIAKNGISLEDYETPDFGIFDDSRAAFLWILHDRKVVGGKIRLDTDDFDRYRTLFNNLWRIAEEYAPKPAESLPAPRRQTI